MVDIERRCEVNTITPDDIITYKFAASINDKKARDNIIKGPLKLQLTLETIELDNYNRKYGDKQSKTKRQRRNSSESTSEDEQVRYTKPATKKKPRLRVRRKLPREIAISAERPTGQRKAKCNFAKSRDTLSKSAEPKP